jgi:hypothetical protein
MAGGENRKAALIAELARSRAQIDGAASEVRARLEVGPKVRRTVVRYRWWWIGGAVLTGLVIALPRRTKKVYVNTKGRNAEGATVAKTGLALAAAKFAFDFARPMLVKWAGRQVADYLRQKYQRDPADV